MSFTNRTAQALLNSLFGKTSNFGALASAPTLYVALSSTTPAEDGTGFTEPVGNAYARVAVPAGSWDPATLADPSAIANAVEVAFAEATGTWGTMTHLGIFDAATAGNLVLQDLLRDPLDAGNPPAALARLVNSGTTLRFAIGELIVTLD